MPLGAIILAGIPTAKLVGTTGVVEGIKLIGIVVNVLIEDIGMLDCGRLDIGILAPAYPPDGAVLPGAKHSPAAAFANRAAPMFGSPVIIAGGLCWYGTDINPPSVPPIGGLRPAIGCPIEADPRFCICMNPGTGDMAVVPARGGTSIAEEACFLASLSCSLSRSEPAICCKYFWNSDSTAFSREMYQVLGCEATWSFL